MSDLVITAANVQAGSATAVTENGTAGEAIIAGQAVYYDAATRTYGLAKSNGASATIRTAWGIALNSAASGQPLRVLKAGSLTLGAVLTAGQLYVLSGAAAGGIAPVGDLATGWYTATLGIAQTSSSLLVGILNGATAHA
jgi:hypothetical protein